MNLKVSVLMGSYNDPLDFLSSTIESVLSQTFKDFEFVIVNDGSSGKILQILENFKQKDSRIKILHNEKNLGLTKSLNKGLLTCSGEYVARIDVGDLCSPERFSEQVKFLDENSAVGIVGSWALLINEKGENIGELVYPPKEDEYIRREMIKHNPFIHASTMFRRVLVEKIGGYNENYKYAQDYDLYFRLLPMTKFANIDKFLLKYRRVFSAQALTFSKNKKQILYANKARINAIRSGYYRVSSYFYVLQALLTTFIPTRFKFFIKRFYDILFR